MEEDKPRIATTQRTEEDIPRTARAQQTTQKKRVKETKLHIMTRVSPNQTKCAYGVGCVTNKK